jgi:hypothetical protein
MYKYFFLFLFLWAAMTACRKQTGWIIENPLQLERRDEVIILTRNEVAAKLAIPAEKMPVFSIDGQQLASQIDDTDGDGKWDEVVILLNVAPSAAPKMIVSFVDSSEYPVFPKRTNLRLGIIQPDGSYTEVNNYLAPTCRDSFKIIAQAESVSWENDKFGFRTYFDCRNVKDLFGKIKPGMIIDGLNQPGAHDYHTLADWGMDVLHCGSSLGSGGIALLWNDSLYRLGSTDVYEYQKIVEGPLRSVFELRYKGWHVDSLNLEAVERISVYPGKYWFQSDVTVKGLPQGAQIVTGIVTSKLTREPFRFNGSGYTCIGTHGIQSLNNDELGMAVIVPEEEVGKIARTTDIDFFAKGFQTVKEKNFSNIISQTYYISQKAVDNQPSRHWFAAVWGLENPQWKTEDGFGLFMEAEMRLLANPLVIKRLKGQVIGDR